MKAVAIQAFGSPEGLAVTDLPDPSPAAGQVLIATEAIGVGGVDAVIRRGAIAGYGFTEGHIPGSEVAGTVTHNAPQDTTKWPHTNFANGVSEGIAGAREIAGDKDVAIASADIARQALDLGLVDEICVSLVPVLLGRGIPYFINLASAPHHFDDPVVIQGRRATHLRYRVRR